MDKIPIQYFPSLQNPYTFAFLDSELDAGFANITSRVPSLRFQRSNQLALDIHDLSDYIKLVMAPSSDRHFVQNDQNTTLSSVFDSTVYNPRVSSTLGI